MQRERTATDVEAGASASGGDTAHAPWGNAIAGVLIALATMVLLWGTLDNYGMAWDEGFTVEREERLREWFARIINGQSTDKWVWAPPYSKLESRADYRRLAGPAADSPWSRQSLRFYWQFAREEPSGHPPFYALLGLAGRVVTHRWLPILESYRVGPAALFALTVGSIYTTMARHYGSLVGLMSAFGLVTMPRVFAHAHLASYDIPTLSFWFLAVMAFLRSSGSPPARAEGWSVSWGWPIAFGLFWGCAMSTKFTGWFVPVPLAAWALFYRDRRSARTLAIGAVVAVAVVYATIPTWWADPIRGLWTFLESNLTRHKLLPIPTEFLGRQYLFSLPWYNTLLFTAITVPPATLALALIGIARLVAGRFRDRVGTMLFGCWAFFMVLKALPNAPGHDSERLFLAAFAFLACLAGIGLDAIRLWLERSSLAPRVAHALAVALLAVVAGAAARSTWLFHPLQLSYYNVLIGGLSGAARAGMEPTYYCEALTPDVREWLRKHTEPGRLIAYDIPTSSFHYLEHWGLLPPSGKLGPTAPRWFVVMNRPGHLKYMDTPGRFLMEYARPVYVKTVPVAADVPLIAIFSGEDAMAAWIIQGRPKPSQTAPDAREGSPAVERPTF